METENHLRRAAECLFEAVESVEPHEQLAMLELAEVWLQRSERIGNSGHERAQHGQAA
jgi:Holliday junction resolvase-like predicted endonuclease